jgi:hypothetical protein
MHYDECVMLSIVMLSVVMLSAVRINVVMLSVVAPLVTTNRQKVINFRSQESFYFCKKFQINNKYVFHNHRHLIK